AIDRSLHSPDEATREEWDEIAALLTPVTKAWCTDTGTDVASLGIQVHGGVGYVEETGAAQLLRDARITPIYEGTNGIQADDLVRRKLGRNEGTGIVEAIADVAQVADRTLAEATPGLDSIGRRLRESVEDAFAATTYLLSASPPARPAGGARRSLAPRRRAGPRGAAVKGAPRGRRPFAAAGPLDLEPVGPAATTPAAPSSGGTRPPAGLPPRWYVVPLAVVLVAAVVHAVMVDAA